MDIHDSATRQLLDFSTQNSLKNRKFSIAMLVEDIKPVVTEEYKFEYREKSKLLAILGTFGLSGFWCKVQNW